MRISPTLFLFPTLCFCLCLCNLVSVASGFCLHDQQLLLLQLKNTLKFNTKYSIKLVSWNQSLSGSEWSGVTCDQEGHVTGLDLKWEFISGVLDNSSALFRLQYLQNLDLSYNRFSSSIPSAIGNLKNLTSLRLYDAGFVGQIPMEISQLTRLDTLDLSLPGTKLENPNLQKLLPNLRSIRRFYLDDVTIAAQGRHEWSNALLALPGLEELSMSNCNLSGPIDSSLTRLENLSIIYLGGNNFSSSMIEIFANFKNLTTLHLWDCNLRGIFPEKIFQVATLSYLDISFNHHLHCFLPNFQPNGSLKTLIVSHTKCSGVLPNSISNLMHLSKLDLSHCQFNGMLPNSLSNLTKFGFLDLSYNNLIGPFPSSFFTLPLLWNLDLSFNNFTGKIKFELIGSLQHIESLDFSYNNLSIDANAMDTNLSFFPKQLSSLNLASCSLREFPMLVRNQSSISSLDLSNNNIEGLIPHWIWKDGDVYYLNLSRNALTGFEGSLINITTEFRYLDLHSNQLQGKIPVFTKLPYYLDLSRNNLSSFILSGVGPQRLEIIEFISLSKNKIYGKISHSWCKFQIGVLDLSNNNLEGTIPECLTQSERLEILNLGNNLLKGNIPDSFMKSCALNTFDLHRNQISGLIPKSLGNCMKLEVLDLGNNQISGNFPCLLKRISSLRVMVLKRNKFHGPVRCPYTNDTWGKLQIIDLSFNKFNGLLPAKELTSWQAMMHFDDQVVSDQTIQVNVYNDRYYQVSVTIVSKGQEWNSG